MERRTALALATAAAGTVLATGAAVVNNVAFASQKAAPISAESGESLDPTTTTLPDPTVVTVYVDDPAPVTTAAPPATVAQTSVSDLDDDQGEDQYVEDEDEDGEDDASFDDNGGDDEHETEAADDNGGDFDEDD